VDVARLATDRGTGGRTASAKTAFLLAFLAAPQLFSEPSPTFSEKIYPVLEKAGCRNCHKVDGVASATRLHFPEEGSSPARIDAFGKSLVELVDRQNPANSLLFQKPTLRIAHTGGERIRKSSAEEAALRSWIDYLAGLQGPELAAALRYRQDEQRGYGVAAQAVLRRLTHAQYNNTVRDLLKDNSDPASMFPPEDYVNGFKNQYEALSVSPILADAYSRAAERLAASAFRRGDSRGLIPCKPASETDAACRTQFIQTFGRRAFRRPLERREVAVQEAIFKREKTFLAGAQAVIETMLQSPSFIFWLEQSPNPKWAPYAEASRLSYFLWATMPDENLLECAARGELDTPEGVGRIARRMLADPRAKAGVDEFVSEWLRFDRVMTASRERRLFPLFGRELAKSMTEEARRFIGDLVWNDRNFMEAFTANYSFINSDLAAVYKVPPPARDFQRVDFPAEAERAGLLGQALFLTLSSKPDDTAPTGRGLFVREQFLCQQVPPPPPGVDTNLPPVEQSKPITNRERLAMHTTNKMCAGCHNLIDPIGFGFEKFDAIGMRRETQKLLFFTGHSAAGEERAKPTEINLELNTKGWIAGISASEFTSPRGLGEILARTPQCQECVVKQVFRYMAGRMDTPADRPVLSQALEDFRKSGYHFKELIITLASSTESADSRSVRADSRSVKHVANHN
jgi:hypothetical protein